MAPYSFMLKFKNKIIIYLVIFVFCSAHSPWGSYLNYRAKHLLIMSVKTDAPTYPFSELLINYINKELPEAQSRPARAKDFERVQSLFSTQQMPLVLLSKQNAKDLINGEGQFKEFGSTEALVLYGFGDLILLIQPSLPNRHAWLLLNALKKSKDVFKNGISPDKLADIGEAHPGAIMALNGEEMPDS